MGPDSEHDDTLSEALRRPQQPLGAIGWLSGAGALCGLALLGALVWASGPLREALAVLRDEGEVRRLAPAEDAPREGAPAHEALEASEEAFLRVRRAALEAYRARRDLLDPIAEGPPPRDPAVGLRRLRAWAELKRVWAEALGREGLTLAAYRALAGEVRIPPGEEAPALDLLLREGGAKPAS